ncbi:MAG: hypothetical protein A3I09_00855 [Deltaproteobacteria bacterium RIFCSPLOWO2_02_FULL_47_10]|nr:MAG: hypothetical protein A3I09_00855 [Deltaproteobacteria bacterium RIFCSPLOWO2_02_FULL_47_10]
MHIIDKRLFNEGLKNKGYRTIGEFANALGFHRNTIHYYLSGHGVFPEALESIINALGLNFQDAIVKKEEPVSPIEVIMLIIDQLQADFPKVAFVLFGSRSKGVFKKYSDWDIGVYKAGGMLHEFYREIVKKKNDLAEDLPFFIDIVNFNNADLVFLKEAAKWWSFLTGSLQSFSELKKKVAL